jgi:ribosomal protein S18 acetylase RimI-like enzyme
MTSVTIVPVHAPESTALLHEYVDELVARYQGRPARPEELDLVIAGQPELAVLLVAHQDGVPAGCVGLRELDTTTGELKRLYVRPAARRRGVAGRLLTAAEQQAHARGWTELRLDTRSDLVEARALYRRHGYTEIDRYNDEPYAHHWFAKPLAQPAP